MPDREDRERGRRGGYAEARPVAGRGALTTTYIIAGLVGGLIAGVIFAVMEMIGAAMMGMPALMPIRMFASILLGEAALSPATSLGVVIPVAVVSHFAISAFWGLIFGLIMGAIPYIRGYGSFALAGVVFGTLIWLIDFYVLAPLIWPWFLEAAPFVQFIMHALFYGLPLGLWVAYAVRRGGRIEQSGGS